MIGLDTTILLEFEIAESPRNHELRRGVVKLLRKKGVRLALTPQVLEEFLHVATDKNRFEKPLSMATALDRCSAWWNASEVFQLFPSMASTTLALRWMREFRLGRKRILDTTLAAIYHTEGVKQVATANANDFHVFDCFQIIDPAIS